MCEFGDLRPQSVGEETFWKFYPKKPKSTFDLEFIFKPITFVEGSKVIHMCEFGDLRPQGVAEETFWKFWFFSKNDLGRPRMTLTSFVFLHIWTHHSKLYLHTKFQVNQTNFTILTPGAITPQGAIVKKKQQTSVISEPRATTWPSFNS